jgi:hypothetical protein
MNRGSLFWGFLLIAVGGLFFLQAIGLIDDVIGFLWPLFLFAAGGWILLGAFTRSRTEFSANESFSIDLQGAQKVNFDFDHGAGQVQVTGGAPTGVAVTGIKGVGMDVSSHLDGDVLSVDVDAGPTFVPFIGPEGGMWQFKLTNDVPVSLDVDAGATSMSFDLSSVKLNRFKMDTGASSTSLVLPRDGQPYVEVESGAASVDITVPDGMAARIRVEGGASSMSIDQVRFPQVDGDLYQSPDFESALNKAEIRLKGGANSVSVHS